AILRVYNRYGRRDNKFKARIKILVKALTPEVFAEKVEAEWLNLKDGTATVTDSELQRVSKYFVSPELESFAGDDAGYLDKRGSDKGFANWASRNVHPHRAPGYAAVTLSLKPNAVAPGDITAEQLEAAADLAEQYSLGEIRSSYSQPLVPPSVRQKDVYDLWHQAREGGFAAPNIGLRADMLCCPGGGVCALADAKSIPLAQSI